MNLYIFYDYDWIKNKLDYLKGWSVIAEDKKTVKIFAKNVAKNYPWDRVYIYPLKEKTHRQRWRFGYGKKSVYDR